MKKVLIFVVCILTAVSLSAQNKLPFYDRGYAGNVELGCLVKSYPYATLSTTHGYCFGKGWFLGLGGAFESGLYAREFENPGAEKFPYEGDMMVKLFLDVRKTFLLKSMGIFVDFKMGGVYLIGRKRLPSRISALPISFKVDSVKMSGTKPLHPNPFTGRNNEIPKSFPDSGRRRNSGNECISLTAPTSLFL